MRPMQWYISGPDDLAKVLAFIVSAPPGYTLTYSKDRDRSSAQNRLLHKWYSEIAKQRGDVTAAEVKAECHVQFGMPILRRDNPVAAYVFQKVVDPLPYEKRLAFFKSGVMAMTSQMSVEQLKEYMDEMAAEYRGRGFSLTEPTE